MKHLIKHRRQPKRETAVAELTLMIRRLEPGAQLPVFMELCCRLNVSKMTLDSALTELEQRSMIHRLPGVGIFVSETFRRTLTILYEASLMEEGSSAFWSLIIDALKIHMEKAGFVYSLRPVHNQENLSSVVAQLKSEHEEGSHQGIITFNYAAEISEPLTRCKIPLVAFAGYADWSVLLDYDYIIMAGTWQLVRRDCQRIGLWELVNDVETSNGAFCVTNVIYFNRCLQQTIKSSIPICRMFLLPRTTPRLHKRPMNLP